MNNIFDETDMVHKAGHGSSGSKYEKYDSQLVAVLYPDGALGLTKGAHKALGNTEAVIVYLRERTIGLKPVALGTINSYSVGSRDGKTAHKHGLKRISCREMKLVSIVGRIMILGARMMDTIMVLDTSQPLEILPYQSRRRSSRVEKH